MSPEVLEQKAAAKADRDAVEDMVVECQTDLLAMPIGSGPGKMKLVFSKLKSAINKHVKNEVKVAVKMAKEKKDYSDAKQARIERVKMQKEALERALQRTQARLAAAENKGLTEKECTTFSRPDSDADDFFLIWDELEAKVNAQAGAAEYKIGITHLARTPWERYGPNKNPRAWEYMHVLGRFNNQQAARSAEENIQKRFQSKTEFAGKYTKDKDTAAGGVSQAADQTTVLYMVWKILDEERAE